MKKIQGHGINDMARGWYSENEWNKMVYQKWHDMLRRCYDENFHKTDKGKSYIGCIVCNRWLTLSNFVEDIPKIDGYDRERFLNGELELDKDIKSNGTNKTYFMKECTFVTRLENQRQANRTRVFSEESKQKMSEAHKGKHHSEETKQKMSENNGMKGKFGSDNPTSMKVAQYDKQTHELIKIWGSIIDVERELGIDQSSISKCCKGKYKSAGGFIWKYAEKYQ